MGRVAILLLGTGLVAACASSTCPGRAAAEFGVKGDGTSDDRAAIQKAVETVANEGGGMLCLAKGIYTISRFIAGKSGVALLCLDAGQCEIQASAPHGKAIVFDGQHGSSVEGFQFTLSGIIPTSADDGVGISLRGGSYEIRILRNRFRGHEHAGIQATSASRVLIAENLFEDGVNTADYTGPVVNGDIVVYGPLSDSVIEKNRCLSRNDHGILLEPSAGAVERNRITENVVENHSLHGINLYAAGTSYVRGNVVDSNVVRNISSRRIAPAGFDYGIGIYVTGNRNGGGMGSGAAQAVGNRVINNRVENVLVGHAGPNLPQGGISVSDAPETVIAHNVVVASDWYGIFHSDNVGAGRGALIEGHRVIGCRLGGIRVLDTRQARVIGNVLVLNGHGGTGWGIRVGTSSQFEISGNYIEGSGSAAIEIDETAADGVIAGNEAERNPNGTVVERRSNRENSNRGAGNQ